jgi:hypothetical protein
MPVQTTIYGTIVIGDAEPYIEIPISTVIPPTTPGVFVFDYDNPDVETAAKINIASFLTWLGSAMNVPIPVNDLPESLRTLTIAVLKFLIDTTGNFNIKIEIGSMVDGKWLPDWKPVASLPLTLSGVGLQTTNMAQLLALAPALRAVEQEDGALAILPATT